jgi:chromosome segregation ATPase
VQAEIEELKRRLVDLEHQGETVEAELEEAEEKRERAVERAEKAAGVVQETQSDVDRLGG